ncbi:MAG: hypothetical protein LUO88_02870 [Methanoregulaceae archaeon]|nr:hypothetical protein [Methanoregulaceae archaeon]
MKRIALVIFAVIALCLCILMPTLAEVISDAGVAGGAGGAGFVQVGQNQQTIAVAVPFSPGDPVDYGNISKLEISPTGLSFRLSPGETGDVSFSVMNRGENPVTVRPRVVQMGYGQYMMEESWVSVAPSEAEIGPDERVKFTVGITIPEGTTRGYYSTQLAMTDEQYPMPYSDPYKNSMYIHMVSLSGEVYAPPVISVVPYSLSDSLEAGKSYDYEFVIANSGNVPIAISPRFESMMYALSSVSAAGNSLTDEAFTISAPAEVPAGGEAVLRLHLDVPSDASGYYSGAINLGTDNPGTGEGTIPISLSVWKQPAVPFEKRFTLQKDGSFTIGLTASTDYYGMPGQGRTVTEPTFDVGITGPDGSVTPVLVKQEIKGSIYLGDGGITPYARSTWAPYQENGMQYISTYSASGKAGSWTVSIMPHNAPRFDYAIILGTVGTETGESPATVTTVTVPVIQAPLNVTTSAMQNGSVIENTT